LQNFSIRKRKSHRISPSIIFQSVSRKVMLGIIKDSIGCFNIEGFGADGYFTGWLFEYGNTWQRFKYAKNFGINYGVVWGNIIEGDVIFFNGIGNDIDTFVDVGNGECTIAFEGIMSTIFLGEFTGFGFSESVFEFGGF
jgi:hypothetical protein